MTLACEQCGSGWPPHLLRLVPLDGCPECRPEAWRAFGSGGDKRLRAPNEQSTQH